MRRWELSAKSRRYKDEDVIEIQNKKSQMLVDRVNRIDKWIDSWKPRRLYAEYILICASHIILFDVCRVTIALYMLINFLLDLTYIWFDVFEIERRMND